MERLREHATIFYCTHILDDVQRVSDAVAILNQGELVTHGPIEELLGGGEIVYTVTLKGNVQSAQERVCAQAWVLGIEASQDKDATKWHVQVTDQETAEENLLPLIMTKGDVRVVNLGLREYSLEEVFLNIVEGKQ
jgi:ABC-2 type transport system ATP-binding protein